MTAQNWHLNKSVPVTLIVGLLVQGAAIVWTVSTMSADIGINRTSIARLDGRVAVIDQSNRGQAISLARIEETLKSIHETLKRIEPNRR